MASATFKPMAHDETEKAKEAGRHAADKGREALDKAKEGIQKAMDNYRATDEASKAKANTTQV